MSTQRPYEAGNPVAEYTEYETGDNADDLNEHAPVAVSVVDPVHVVTREPRYITTAQVPVGLVPVQVVPALRSRASLLMVVRGSSSVHVYIGGHGAISAGSGFLVTPDNSLAIEANGEVWAVADAAGSTIHWLAQHRDG